MLFHQRESRDLKERYIFHHLSFQLRHHHHGYWSKCLCFLVNYNIPYSDFCITLTEKTELSVLCQHHGVLPVTNNCPICGKQYRLDTDKKGFLWQELRDERTSSEKVILFQINIQRDLVWKVKVGEASASPLFLHQKPAKIGWICWVWNKVH